MEYDLSYRRGFLPYGLGAFLIGIVGGFSSVLGPAFVQDLGLDYNNTTWTALAQAMSTAACAPVLGKLGDVLGRRKTLLFGIAVFAAGNVFSALAGSLPVMLVARFVVGLGIAAMTPVILAYIVTRFPADRMARGFSLYMLISSASVVAGPTLGGLIISAFGWRVMLWICAALCAAVLLLCSFLPAEKELRGKQLQNFDRIGAVFVPAFFGLLLCIPSFGQNFGWRSGAFGVVLAAALLALPALILGERRAKQPILSGSFFRRRRFLLSVLILFLTQGLMQANMTNIIVFVNETLPDNTVVSGYAISVMYLGMALGAVLLGPLADRVASKGVLTGALLLTACGCGLLQFFSAVTPTMLLMSALGILGVGLGGSGSVLMKIALAGALPEEAAAATGTYTLFRDLSAPFGVAVLVPLFTNRLSALSAAGMSRNGAAVASLHGLAAVELVCVAVGIIVVFCLPGNGKNRDSMKAV